MTNSVMHRDGKKTLGYGRTLFLILPSLHRRNWFESLVRTCGLH